MWGLTAAESALVEAHKNDRNPPADVREIIAYIQQAKNGKLLRVVKSLEHLEAFLAQSSNICNLDLSRLDFSSEKGKKILGGIEEFADSVVWPTKMAQERAEMLERAKDPGLGVRALHRRGWTGKGVSVAIIDQPLLIEHPEYAGRVRYYREIGFSEYTRETGKTHKQASYHGPAVASLSVGKECGTAPGADLVFVATHNWLPVPAGVTGRDSTYECASIRHVLELNRTLPESEKIRCLSCSFGRNDDYKYEERQALFKQAEEEGIMVFGGYYPSTIGRLICGLERDVAKTDEVSAYCPEREWGKRNHLLIPEHQRAFAAASGGYIYGEKGGYSWTCPYMAGVVACALQAYPDFARQKGWPDKMWAEMWNTGVSLDKKDKTASRVINPPGLVDRMLELKRAKGKTLAAALSARKRQRS
ncbi:MAG: S8/S53 family peptidase [Alphaproteobacteria bacterium]|nr:S8/S53 family peptidase [Alphaproteobacteria bacterium]